MKQRLDSGKSIFLLAEDIPDLALGSDPDALARQHPLWDAEIAAWGPWKRSEPASIPQVDAPDGFSHPAGWLSAKSCATQIIVCVSCSSAFDLAWKLWDRGLLTEWGAVITVDQWAGRGQVRRPWSSLPGNLHVVWRLPAMAPEWDGLASLVPAWLIARALSKQGLDIQIKWPNDLLCKGGKAGGILVEQRGKGSLAGLGLNLASCPKPDALRERTAVSTTALDGRISPVKCWNLLVSEGVYWYETILPFIHPDDFVREFSTSLAWRGRSVLLHEHGHENGLPAVVLGVSAQGGLVVDMQGVKHTIFSGEIQSDPCKP